MFADDIVDLVKKFDEIDLIGRFDVDFDAPLRHKYAIGILQMHGAFDPVPDGDYHAAAVRVGAHWCAIVRADVNYELLEGLRLVSSSRGDAERLRSALGEGDRLASVFGNAAEFAAYAVARWYDGAGKILYRLGSHSRARISFETAVEVANAHSLNWCLPDLLSNFYRVQYEEIRQAEATEQDDRRLRTLVNDLTTECDRIAADVEAAQTQVQTNHDDPPVKLRELLRGYSSVLHNLAVALKAHSLEMSRESLAVSKLLGDDLLSNFYRVQYEEIRQAEATEQDDRRLRILVDDLTTERDRLAADVDAAQAQVQTNRDDPPVKLRELLRGYSSILHNLAVALKTHSLEVSRESLAVSELLGDVYRIGQSRNHQVLLKPVADRTPAFEALRDGEWRRGRLIAKQQLADLAGGEEGVVGIESLLNQLAHDSETTGGTGMDIDLYAFSVQVFASIVKAMKTKGLDTTAYERQLSDQRRIMAESVRSAVALPAYKRAYAKAVRPSYLEAIQSALDDAEDAQLARWEKALRLAEESTARELLDMLASAGRQLPEEEAAPWAWLTSYESGMTPPLSEPRDARRAEVQAVDTGPDDELVKELAQRETEFEEQFLRQPLEASPPDPEIAHRIRMYTVNNPGTCVVRFVTYGPTVPTRLGAFIFRGHAMRFVEVSDYAAVHKLVAEPFAKPSPKQANAIWELLVAPLWSTITEEGVPSHLVMIPTDDLFAIPLHLACASGTTAPLAALVPLSQSVSATAFVARGRSLLKLQPVAAEDDLAAIVVADGKVTGAEIVETGWDPAHTYVAGSVPGGMGDVWHLREADFSALAAISAVKPEFFVYAGHGNIHPSFPELGPYLQMEGARLTQYDVALRLRLPRNKLTVLGACVAGRGAHTAGGDVVGFLRSLIAAGAGAVALPLWSVLDDEMVDTVYDLLVESRRALKRRDRAFDVVQTLHQRYARLAGSPSDSPDLTTLLERMPISLYL